MADEVYHYLKFRCDGERISEPQGIVCKGHSKGMRINPNWKRKQKGTPLIHNDETLWQRSKELKAEPIDPSGWYMCDTCWNYL
jgi:hypothetical protein